MLSFTMWPALALASAGGGVGAGFGGFAGHGLGRGGDSPPLIFWVLTTVIVALVWVFSVGLYDVKACLVRITLLRSARTDSAWAPSVLKRDVGNVFASVQRGWASGRMEHAKTLMSAELGARLDETLERLRQHDRRNVMKDLKLKRARVVGVRAHGDPSQDRIWVLFEARLIDFILDENSRMPYAGDPRKPRDLRELWTFARGNDGWIVDEIDQSPNRLPTVLLPQRVASNKGFDADIRGQ